METILNIAWAVCTLGLVWFWVRNSASNDSSRKTQVLALAMVVLLLLPVISLSDDLLAAQSPAETDSGLRRATQGDQCHPSAVPVALGLPEQVFAGLPLAAYSGDLLLDRDRALTNSMVAQALDSRPPPRA